MKPSAWKAGVHGLPTRGLLEAYKANYDVYPDAGQGRFDRYEQQCAVDSGSTLLSLPPSRYRA